MRKFAIILNCAVLFFVLFLLVHDGFPSDIVPVFALILVTSTSCFSIYALFKSADGNSDNWLSLYLRRKALEEKKKIEELSK